MLRDLHQALMPVRWRQRLVRGVSGCAIGATMGAVIGVGIEIARLMGSSYDPLVSWLSVASGATLGALCGSLAPVSWKLTARLVDTHYKLQDRTLTALSFATRDTQDPLVTLQLQDALERLQSVSASDVLPLRTPKMGIGLALVLALMIGLVAIPRQTAVVDPALVELRQVVNEQAVALEETMLEDLRELVEKHPEPELKELTKELEEMVDQLKSPEVNQREALAKISEMQQALAAAMDKLDLQHMDAQLQEFAAALEPAELMQAIAESLKAGKYGKAAQELEKFDTKNLDRKSRDAVAANLKKFNKNLDSDGKPGELSDAAKEMQDGLEDNDEKQCKNGQCKAAAALKKQEMKKQLSQCMSCQLNRLKDCKGQCQSAGQCPSDKFAKSDKASKKAGVVATNQPTGENATSIESNRQRDKIAGIQGEGPSEREVSNSPEGEQTAARTYSQRYTEYKKQMEEVLDSEPLPLGHRETVRKYFESIRPSDEK